LLAHLPHHLSLIGHHRHTQFGREINVVAGQGRGLFCVQPPDAVVFADMAKGVFERQLGFAHPTQALDGLGERGGLSRGQGLVQLGQGLVAVSEIGIALLGDVPDGGQAAWEARARRHGGTARERRLDLGARVFPVPLLQLGDDPFPRLSLGNTNQVQIRTRGQQTIQVALRDAQGKQLFFDQRSLPLFAAPSGIKVGRRQQASHQAALLEGLVHRIDKTLAHHEVVALHLGRVARPAQDEVQPRRPTPIAASVTDKDVHALSVAHAPSGEPQCRPAVKHPDPVELLRATLTPPSLPLSASGLPSESGPAAPA